MPGSDEGEQDVLVHIPEHNTSDPKPATADSTEEERKSYKEAVNNHAVEWCDTQEASSISRSDIVWSDFTCDLSPTGIQNMNDRNAVRLRNILISNGVFVNVRRGLSKKKALQDCWEEEECPLLTSERAATGIKASSNPENVTIGTASVPATDVQDGKKVTTEAKECSEDKPFSFSGKINENGVQVAEKDVKEVTYSKGISGLQGLIKAYGNRPKYKGGWDEDLVGTIEIFELSSAMCEISRDEMLKGVPIMLDGGALSYFASNIRNHVETYDDAIQKLKDWFTSDEQRTRLLQEWREINLSLWFRQYPEKSESDVFRILCEKLTSGQRQLHEDYRNQRFLRDQLIAATDLENVSRALKENLPATAHDATQKIASLLSSEPGSAGRHTTEGTNAFYGLGRRYGGQAERRIRHTGKSKSRRDPTRKRLARIKGCWVCGKEHFANNFHSKQEVTAALSKHKESGAYVSVEDVMNVFLAESESGSDFESESEEDTAHVAMTSDDCSNVNRELELSLSNTTFLHSCGFFTYRNSEMKKMEQELMKNNRDSEFNGIMFDTGANRTSLMSLKQYLAYCKEHGVPAIHDGKSKRVGGLGGGGVHTVGSAIISVPFPNLGIICDIPFHISEDDNCPTLLCLRDLKRTGLELSIQNTWVEYMGRTEKLVLENDFLYYRWKPDCALFSYGELAKLHRSFGHPSVSALYKLLKRARLDTAPHEVQDAIKYLTKGCKTCVELAGKPKRFKLTIGTEDSKFNSTVAADVMFIRRKPILHVVDEATNFAAATFLRNMSSKEVWKASMRSWVHVYMGPPDFLKLDQGSNFTSKEFRGMAEVAGIGIIQEPIESPASMSQVERYHGPLRTAFEKLENELPKENKSDLLQMAVHCVNNTVGPEGLCPTLCVFGAMPRPAREIPAPDQISRAKAIDGAMEAVAKDQAKHRIAFGLKYRCPYGKEQTQLDKLSFGAPVRVYREKSKTWEGPFKFISKEGETICVQLCNGRRIFRSHVVKPDFGSELEDICQRDITATNEDKPSVANHCSDLGSEQNGAESDADSLSDRGLKAMFGEEDGCNLSVQTTSSLHDFSEARQSELDGLKAAKVFRIVSRDTVPAGARIYGTRFVDVVKQKDNDILLKSRLVAQNYRDHNARHIPTKAPTISKMGQRISLSLAAANPYDTSYTRDVTQAYTQSKSKLERRVYLKPPPEMNLPEDKVLVAVKPICGVPESALHWFITYRDHHVDKLQMTSSTVDPCILYRRDTPDSHPDVIALQVDDSNRSGSQKFLDEEDKASKVFKTKPRELLKVGDSCMFNGSRIAHIGPGVHSMNQKEKFEDITLPNTDIEALSARAKLQYIATATRPDIASPTQLLTAELSNANPDAQKQLKKIIQYTKKFKESGLKFVRVNKRTSRIVLFTDASFGNAAGLSSQTGFVVLIADEDCNANILHYGSRKCRRVTRSVMPAELLSLVHGFDQACVVKTAMEEILGMKLPLDAYADSRTTFSCVAKHASTTEKRLQIDVAALRESYTRGEVRCLGWIPGYQNPADGLTKSDLLSEKHPLVALMKTNKLCISPEGWVFEKRPLEVQHFKKKKE